MRYSPFNPFPLLVNDMLHAQNSANVGPVSVEGGRDRNLVMSFPLNSSQLQLTSGELKAVNDGKAVYQLSSGLQ